MNQRRPEVPLQISDWRAFAGFMATILAVVAIAYALMSGVYSVAAHEQAVVLRFGKYLRSDPPGLHFKFHGSTKDTSSIRGSILSVYRTISPMLT